jgi:NAD(P)-dependent dehydrogenase (short-subunit alcohol dehydrogenase family)
MQDLNGKRVVITGGSQELGLAMVEALAACGANVAAIGRESRARRCWAKPGEGEHVGRVTQLTNQNRNGSDGSEFPGETMTTEHSLEKPRLRRKG